MDYNDRWKTIEKLGEGGQGKVFRVLDTSKFNLDGQILPDIARAIQAIGARVRTRQSEKEHLELFKKAIVDLFRMEDSFHHGALKVLHKPQDARDAHRADDRIKREIHAMSDISHPNLLRILDADPDSKWFVSQYHPKGTLDKNRGIFGGNFAKSLKAFRPLVEGVSELHKKNFVHRDIKPQNIFLDSDGNLILGDFGLVFYSDEQHTRISDTLENVGSRDWMPAWAMGIRVEDIRPTFDVFSLGKLLWSMVSGSPILRLWYFDKPEFNLEVQFPDEPSINLANPLFKKCIVENEEDCFPDATKLLAEVDKILSIIDSNADRVDDKSQRRCKVCGVGKYRLTVNRDITDTRNFGFDPHGNRSMKIFVCNHCGNVQMFAFDGGLIPPAWENK